MKFVQYEKKDSIAIITVNRPEKLNTYNEQTLIELRDSLQEAHADTDVLCVIFTAAGEKAFSAGGDIDDEKEMTAYEGYEFAMLGQSITRLIRNHRVPVIAAVFGYDLGGGMEFTLACDFVIAAEGSKMGLPSVRLGLVNSFGGTQLLPRIVGVQKAKEIMFTGRHVKADEARELGIALSVVPKDSLLSAAIDLAEKIVCMPPFAVRCYKESINRGVEMSFEDGMLLEANMLMRSLATDDNKEAVAAFKEKRQPKSYTSR